MQDPAVNLHRRWLLTLGAGALWPLQAAALVHEDAQPPQRLQLALEAPPDIDPAGHLVSEKMDGVRACWDGHGLHFRSGLPIVAPAWFVAALPSVPLDGELWLGRGRFEALSGIVRRAQAEDAGWRALRYGVFDLPAAGGPFSERAQRLQALAETAGAACWAPVAQARLPDRAALQRRLREVVAAGGEGLVLHRADAPWAPGRSGALFKLKPLHDAEAQVLGHLGGRGKHAGRLGALRLRTALGVEFNLGTGFSDAVREAPPPPGAWVTYSHRGHTRNGTPRFASYLRLREP